MMSPSRKEVKFQRQLNDEKRVLDTLRNGEVLDEADELGVPYVRRRSRKYHTNTNARRDSQRKIEAGKRLRSYVYPPLDAGAEVAHSIPWARRFPELYLYYINHRPDFTGMNLYMADMQFPREFLAARLRSPACFTVQVCHSEMARLRGRLPAAHIVELKSHAIMLVNKAINEQRYVNETDVVTSVTAMALHELVYEQDFGNAEYHLSGLRSIIELTGGIKSLNQQPSIQNLLHAADGMYSYLTGKARFFPVHDKDAAQIIVIQNPLRLAIQPLRSNLSTTQLRNHLLVSIGAPVQLVLMEMLSIKKLARAALQTPYRLSPILALAEAEQIESRLMDLGLANRRFGLDPAIFSQVDCELHYNVVECARYVTLVLVSKTIEILRPSAVSAAHVDGHVQSLHMAISTGGTLASKNEEILFWALFTGTSFTDSNTGSQRNHLVEQLRRLSNFQVNLRDYASVQKLLDKFFWVPEIQETQSKVLWDDIINHG